VISIGLARSRARASMLHITHTHHDNRRKTFIHSPRDFYSKTTQQLKLQNLLFAVMATSMIVIKRKCLFMISGVVDDAWDLNGAGVIIQTFATMNMGNQ
jgi:hypothetical protein